MKTKLMLGLSCVLALSLAACSGSDGESLDGSTYLPDAAVPTYDVAAPAVDTAPPPVTYAWVVIQDTEQVACATNGPGADIDAVVLYDATGVLGVGLRGSATFTKNPGGWACSKDTCGASGTADCKYAANSDTYTEADLVARTEGPADATVDATLADTGYFSLNAGTLQMQIGDATGAGLAQALKSGDYIKVYEVDQSYIASGAAFAGCICGPEHYTVAVQTAAGATVQLKAVQLDAYNTTCTALAATSVEGCGSTVFMVP
jgi:hypothetical protein